MDLLSNQTTGIQTAWLLATLGSKASQRNKIIKKDNILNVSIPEICQDLINTFDQPQQPEQQPNRNIKFASNILYGLSILYKSKISYILNDLNYIQIKLLNSLKFNKNLSLPSTTTTTTTSNLKRSRFFENDECFNISIDFLPNLNLDQPFTPTDTQNQPQQPNVSPSKRRKLEIARFDASEFPIFDQSTTLSTSGALNFALSLSEQESREVENFLNSPIHQTNIDDDDLLVGQNRVENNDALSNIRFNRNDELQLDRRISGINSDHELGDLNEQPQEEMEQQRRSLIEVDEQEQQNDLDLGMEVELSPDLLVGDENVQDDQDDQDEEFQAISGDATQQQQPTREDVNTRISNLRSRRLVVDERISLNTSIIIENNDNYEQNMIQLRNQQQQRQQRTSQQLIEEIQIMLNHSTLINTQNSRSLSRINEINQLTQSMANEDSEQPRNIESLQVENSRIFNESQQQQLQDMDLDLGDDNEQEQDHSQQLNFEDNIQEMDFELQASQRTTSSRLSNSQHILNLQSLTLSDNEDSTTSQNQLNIKLQKFLKYFMEKSIELNTFTTITTVNEVEKQFTLNFHQLVPPPSSTPSQIPINNKKIAINSFATILILLNKNILDLKILNQQQQDSETNTFNLLKPKNLEMCLKLKENELPQEEEEEENQDVEVDVEVEESPQNPQSRDISELEIQLQSQEDEVMTE
ncbi:hypothetical protein KGF54_002926 [Candida jiufengensis]|uniref:uncharacterized protein n=1 Tax=Candida jiufengensis TaxID=497108 RepID=UPI002223F68F|nr:uncharacterized protein KGF54_002926 [Candida jiufengensis]KAI5953554.1 hypothetical protein KGF54_002926 [Candida jiufengensis]